MTDPLDDCPLPVRVQYRNIACIAAFWGIYYLAAPVSYIGLTHANLLKTLGNSDTICNLPAAMYLWLTVVQIPVSWWFPRSRHVKPLAITSIAMMAIVSAAVAVALGSGMSAARVTVIVAAHGAVFGAANGVVFAAMWDMVRRGISTSRRGAALGWTFGVGPLFACVGALLQDALFDGKLLGGRTFGLQFPDNYLAMFAAVSPLFLLSIVVVYSFTVPTAEADAESPLAKEIAVGLKQFFRNRAVLFAILLYVIVYSGGNGIFQNMSLHAKAILGDQADTLGVQSFLRFGCKALAGVTLGWLLATYSPRATLLVTTSILLLGVGWALGSSGWWFMVTFGLLGMGELFGAYFPNYVTTASEKKYVRVNIAYMNVISALVGFSSIAYGVISDHFSREASFYAAGGLLVLGLALIVLLLPANPTPRESSTV